MAKHPAVKTGGPSRIRFIMVEAELAEAISRRIIDADASVRGRTAADGQAMTDRIEDWKRFSHENVGYVANSLRVRKV